MKKLRNLLSRIRLVRRRSSTPVKCAVIAALACSTAAVIALSIARANAEKREKEAQKQYNAFYQENHEIRDKISDLGTVDSIKDIAENVLGLVDPDTIVYEITQAKQ